MSDTDDTDLLLLIPPDFFLVHSPDLGVDSDCEINGSSVKDSIVSDLITQVNDLESRICMIEKLDKSATLCSTFHDESYINHSLNSLTESDILRFKENENNLLPANDPLEINHMQHELPANIEPYNRSVTLDQPLHFEEGLFVRNEIQLSNSSNSDNDCIKTCETVIDSENGFTREKKTDLLTEIDTFLCSGDNNKSVVKYFTDSAKNIVTGNTPSIITEGLPTSTSNFVAVQTENHSQSLALPQVHRLLKEMEDTQHEIERKLMLRNSKHLFQESKNETFRPLTSTGLEDLSTSPLKMLPNNQMDNVLNRKHSQGMGQDSENNHSTNNADVQLGCLLKSSSISNNEGSVKSDSRIKSLSPSRSKFDIHSPLDVLKLISKKEKGNTAPLIANDNISPTRNSSFRRYLNFERKQFSPRSSKSKQSLQFHPPTKGSLVSDSRHMYYDTNEKSLEEYSLRSSAGVRSIHPEGKNRNLSNERVTSKPVNHSTTMPLENKTNSNELLQQRFSSNNLLSLSELWNNEPTFYSDDPNKLRQKLEEEKYRRQHCEQQIQTLQLRILEDREKLAVAIKVDQEKDKAILQITESWKKLNEHWSELEEQRHSLAQQLQAEKESSKLKNDDLMKKIEKWEKEVSQALDLALGYKEKSESTQKQMNSLKHETDKKLEEAEGKINKITEENEKLAVGNNSQLKQLHCLQDRINEEENLLSKLKTELEKSNKQLADYEADFNVIKEQKETLAIKAQEANNRISVLEKQKKELEVALTESIQREKTAQEGARLSNERIEVARTELRALYQGQLETVVKEKLQEFQNQLDAAEAALKNELYSKEKQWIEKSNHQYKQLQEKYSMDLCRIEESYKSENNKWKKKLMESEKLRSISENHLLEEKNKRAEIAYRLHSVMENQWREALNIISNPTQSMYEIFKEDKREVWPSNHENAERLNGGGDLRASRSNSGSSLLQCDDVPFCREGAVTSRKQQSSQDHPQLKNYIEMLLKRGSQQDSLQLAMDQTFSPETSFMYNKWMMDNERNSGEKTESIQTHKPPWK